MNLCESLFFIRNQIQYAVADQDISYATCQWKILNVAQAKFNVGCLHLFSVQSCFINHRWCNVNTDDLAFRTGRCARNEATFPAPEPKSTTTSLILILAYSVGKPQPSPRSASLK